MQRETEMAARATLAPWNVRSLDGVRVLVVDDHAVARSLMTAMVEGLGALATVVASGEECIEAAERGRFDVVLVDLGLPDMMGDKLSMRLSRAEGTRTAPIIAVTGLDRPAEMPTSFADWLLKPFSVRDLHRMILAHVTLDAVATA